MAQSIRRRIPRRLLIPVILLPLVAAAASFGYRALRESQQFVGTDNAQLSGTPIQVGPVNGGRVESIAVHLGSRVRKGDVVAQVALPSQVGMAQNGQPKFDYLGGADSKVDVTSPINGMVLAVLVGIGASVQPQQAIVEVVDPSQLWVTANVDETSIARVRVGQPVAVHIDTLDADVPGVVDAITPAAASTFSLLPSNTSSGNFNKVTQLVPVRVRLALGDEPALLGTSVEVKIRVAD